MTVDQARAIQAADKVIRWAGLPSYTDLLAFAERMAYKEAGCLLQMEDFENIARNIVEGNAQ